MGCMTSMKETAAKKPTKISVAKLRGDWELVFSSKIGKGNYFPITEYCNFLGFSLTSNWKFIPFGKFEGSSTLKTESPLVLDFVNKKYSLGFLQVLLKNQQKRSYEFLYIDNDFAVGKSSAGSLTLLKKCSESV